MLAQVIPVFRGLCLVVSRQVVRRAFELQEQEAARQALAALESR
jgi:hypothetical protein